MNSSAHEEPHTIPDDAFEQYHLEQYRLVIVEDDFMIYKSLKYVINKHFPMIHIVGHCESVEEVITIISAEKPDIVLLDIQLRGGLSFKGLAEVQGRNFDCIVMSAQARFHYAQEAMRYGASEYLVKPFLPEDIIAALQTVMAKRKARLSQAILPPEIPSAAAPVSEEKPKPASLRAIIVDDEKAQRFALSQKITDIFHDRISIVAEAFSVDSAITAIQQGAPDIVFLDIDLIGGTGFDVLDVFPHRTFEVIIVSSHPHFAQQAFQYETLDYLVKPVEPEHLARAVERAFAAHRIKAENGGDVATTADTEAGTDDSINKSSKDYSAQAPTLAKKLAAQAGYWTFKASDKTLHSLAWEQIIRLEADGRNTIIYHTKGEPLTVSRSLQKCLADLPSSLFYLTHRSHAINRKHFVSARDYFATLSNGDRVDVSTRLWAKFVAEMLPKER